MSENLTRALFGFASDMLDQTRMRAQQLEDKLREKMMKK